MEDAQKAGYINDTAEIDTIFDEKKLDDIDLSSLLFNGSMDGALEFYNRLYSVDYPKYNKHTLYCYYDQYENVTRNESFQKYDLGINGDDIMIATCIPNGSGYKSNMISILIIFISLIMAIDF